LKDRAGLPGDSAKEFIGQADGAIAIQESSVKVVPSRVFSPGKDPPLSLAIVRLKTKVGKMCALGKKSVTFGWNLVTLTTDAFSRYVRQIMFLEEPSRLFTRRVHR
jgi:hypothetical protein